MTQHIRYIGHDPNNRLPRTENDVYKKLCDIIIQDEKFNSISDTILDEFKSSWKMKIKKGLNTQLDMINYWPNEINTFNMSIYHTDDIANGMVYVKGNIAPKTIKKKANDKAHIISSLNDKFQLNVEIGVFYDDYTYGYILENLYLSEN